MSSFEGRCEVLHGFFHNQFNDPCEDPLPEWVNQTWHSSVLDPLVPLDGALVRKAAIKMKDGKACADDLVVAEMIKAADEKFYDVLADAFRLRLLNHVSETSVSCHSDA